MPSSGIRPFAERNASGGPACDESVEETIALSLPASFHVADDVGGRLGVLHVTTRRLVWFADDDKKDYTQSGFVVPFKSLTMHAISTDTTDGFKPCIYAQVEGPAPEGFKEKDEDDDCESDDDEFDEMTELRVVPIDPAKLDLVFKTLCECAAMNPDDEDEEYVEDDGDGLFYNEAEVATGAGAAARLEQLAAFDKKLSVSEELEQHVSGDPGRFED